MYRVWKLTEEDKKKPHFSFWTGDCLAYSVFETEEEMAEELERVRKIEEESKRAYEEYIASLK